MEIQNPLSQNKPINGDMKKHRHKFETIRGTNYCIKRCEICGEMYEKKKKPKNNPKK